MKEKTHNFTKYQVDIIQAMCQLSLNDIEKHKGNGYVTDYDYEYLAKEIQEIYNKCK